MIEINGELASCFRTGNEINVYVLRKMPCPKKAVGVGLLFDSNGFVNVFVIF
jgi:hypothetical protein